MDKEDKLYAIILKTSYIRSKYDDTLDDNDRKKYKEELADIKNEINKFYQSQLEDVMEPIREAYKVLNPSDHELKIGWSKHSQGIMWQAIRDAVGRYEKTSLP